MATFPSIETVLMEIHQSLELKQDQTVIPPFLKGVHSTGHDNTLVSRGDYRALLTELLQTLMRDNIWILQSRTSLTER